MTEPGNTTGRAVPLSPHLSEGLLERAMLNIQSFESWLEAGALWGGGRSATARSARIAQLDAVLTLIGLSSARQILAEISTCLMSQREGDSLDADTRLLVASAFLRLRNCLDQQSEVTAIEPLLDETQLAEDEANVQRSLARRIELTRSSHTPSDDDVLVYLSRATACLVREARHSLGEAVPALDGLFHSSDGVEVPLPVVAAPVRSIARALDILPLPEVSALIDGLAEMIELGAPADASDFGRLVARLVVEIDACLDGFVQAGLPPSEALDRAEIALSDLRRAMPAAGLVDAMNAMDEDAMPFVVAEPPADLVPRDRDLRALTSAALDALDDIGGHLHRSPNAVMSLLEPLRTLERIGRRSGHPDLSRLCGAALDLLDTAPEEFSQAQRVDVHAVLPQLIAGLGVARAARQVDIVGLDELIQSLVSSAGIDSATEQVAKTVTESLEERGAGSSLLSDTPDSQSASASLHSVFISECGVHLDTLDTELSVSPVRPSKALIRALHTLCGSAQTVGAQAIVEIIEPMQQRVARCRKQRQDLDANDIDALAKAAAEVRGLLDQEWEGPDSARLAQLQLDHMSAPLADVFAEEARELLGRLRLDEGGSPATEALRARSLSALHTLKGSARIAGWSALAELAHEHESIVQSVSLEQLAVSLTSARRELEAASPGVVAQGILAEPVVVSGDARVPENSWERLVALSSDVSASQARLTVEIDKLSAAARELETAAHRWRRLPAASGLLESEAARELLADIDSVRATLDTALRGVDSERRLGARAGRALQQNLVRARLVRVGDAEPRLQEVVADAAVAVGVNASLSILGEDMTVDGGLFRRLLPAVEQLLRNAIVHGIEPPDDRLASGKVATGRLTVELALDGLDIRLRVVDDGRGLADGVASIQQLELSGYSTVDDAARDTEQLGGHGLGLASIRNLMDELGGDLALVPVDVGACFELHVPQQIPVQQVVLVEAGGVFGIPVNSVREIVSVEQGCAEPGSDALELTHLLGVATQDNISQLQIKDASLQRCLVLVSQEEEVRVLVDAVVGYREVVVQVLGQQLASLGMYSGATVLADGRSALLLSPTAWQQPPLATESAAGDGKARQPVVLVADDSPTQRSWLREHLGQWGLQVIETRDGQEALDVLGALAIDLLLLDIDMPRIDGFGVLEALHQSEAAVPPVIMLSSRSSQRDREAAVGLGAREFLAKPASPDELQQSIQVVLGTTGD